MDLRLLGRAVLVWLAIVAAETLHGIARTLWLEPVVGEFRARQIAFGSGCLIIFVVACLLSRWLGARTVKEQFLVGLLWALLMAAFEVVLGRLAFGFPWERIFQEYDLSRGGLMGFGLLWMILVPWLAALCVDAFRSRARARH